jgi:Ca-activated chloride channel family protein
MIVFDDPRWLWGLLAVPALALIEWLAARRADEALLKLAGRRAPHPLLEQRRPGHRRLGAALRLAALASLLVGAAGPQWGREVVRRTASGSDVLMLIDVSASMDARDVPPSRLDEARREALALLERLGGSRVGVIAFAGDAVRLSPLTQDLGTVRLVVEGLTSATVSQPGTDLGRALRLAARMLPPARREEQAVVLWTDGEDLERGARDAVQSLSRAGVRVFAVGVGTPSGDVVPELDDQGRAIDIKRDAAGTAVRSRLDEGLLRTIARETRGGYYSASRPGGELPRLLAAVSTLARADRGVRLVERPVARFPLFAAAAALMLAVEVARPRRRGGAARVRRDPAAARGARGPRRTVAAALLLALLAPPAAAQSPWARGDQAFRAGRFGEAESLYAQRARRAAPPALEVNLGTTRVLSGRVEQGEALLRKHVETAGEAGRAARYNLGTLQALAGRHDEALAALRGALERAPDDEDARWNYELALRRREAARQRPRPGPGDRPPPPEPQQPPEPRPSPDQGTGAPPPEPPPGQAPNPGPPDTPPSRGQGGMTRSQAEQILGALQDLQRAEEQRQRRVRVLRERRGRDW